MDLTAAAFRPGDQALVEIAVDECVKLGLGKYAPNAVKWTSRLPFDQCILSRGYLMMPQQMNGRLQPEEWRPIIASAALQRKLIKNLPSVARILVLWGLATVVLVGASVAGELIAFALSLGAISGFVAGVLGPSIILFVFMLMFRSRVNRNRELRLSADLQARDQSGTDLLLDSLKKIQSFDSGIGPKRVRLVGWPNVGQRIQNLEKHPLSEIHTLNSEEFDAFRKRWKV